ncbi:MAG: undecaprenyl-diphosphate phosphatase [Lactobacillales bacterium]|jgi:undecaprenyl-diphosphatase|nr:undecaprenyl-diphosphate phosphatase [Lactobacillales bacterium]
MLWGNVLKAIILGIIQGITEWLPISSTGHMILVDEFIKLNESKVFMNMFEVVIQLGSILAVVVLYFHKLNPFSSRKKHEEKQDTWSLWLKVFIAIIPSVIIGLKVDDWLDAHMHKFFSVALLLIIYGIAFIVIERIHKNKSTKINQLKDLTIPVVLAIGFFQVLALIPGTSRSGATILGGIIFGCSRFIAAEFSFFLAVPTMFGASGLKIFKFLIKGNAFTVNQLVILAVGSFVAFIVSVIVIKFLMRYIQTKDFQPFGWYRIVLGIVLIGYVLLS